MEVVLGYLNWLWTLGGVRFIVGHILVNVCFAVAASMRAGEFDFQHLSDFITTKLLPYVIAYGAVKLVGVDAGVEYLALPLWAVIEATLTANLAENLKVLGIAKVMGE